MSFRRALLFVVVCILLVLLQTGAWAKVDYDRIYQETLAKWTRTQTVRDTFSVEAVYWSEELVQAWVAKYGSENLLSSEEQEAYHRDYIQREGLNRYLVFEVTLRKLKGPALYPMDFAKNTYLVDDKGNKWYPVKYDPGFEEKIHREFTGKIYFARFDKEGNPIINQDTEYIALHFAKISISPSLISEEVLLRWDKPYLPPDYSKPEWRPLLEEEILRLEERVKELELQKENLEEQKKKIEAKIEELQQRIKELEAQKSAQS
ncbi:MAG: hypothetical protein PWP42_902 [Candidatus Atribacteria bacterium]|nr:hypothetical protein [Candidatus Atribacteria bacterium]